MATTHLGPDLRATGCTVLGELVLAYLEQALDLAAAADRDARLEELETLIEGRTRGAAALDAAFGGRLIEDWTSGPTRASVHCPRPAQPGSRR